VREVKLVLLGEAGVCLSHSPSPSPSPSPSLSVSQSLSLSHTHILGVRQVGKSSLVLRFVANHFKAYSESTIGYALGLNLSLSLVLPRASRRLLSCSSPSLPYLP
jgi:hypothetical protein